MTSDTEFIEKVQSLLNEGNSRNKVASILQIHHSKVDRLVRRGLVDVYVAFDEYEYEYREHNTGNIEWVREEDELEKLCDTAIDKLEADFHEVLGDNVVDVGRYVMCRYGNFQNYLKEKGKSQLFELFTKRCTACDKHRRITQYSKKKNHSFGINLECNMCQAERLKFHYQTNENYRNTMKIANKKWRLRNKERLKIVMQRANHIRLARRKFLPDDLTAPQLAFTLGEFKGCALTGSSDTHLDHVIPLSIGHGGTTYGNMIPLRADLNLSKNNSNIFEWFEANRQRFELSQERFNNIIAWLASANAMSVEEYRDYVYWCHANPRNIGELVDEKDVI